MSEQPPDSYWKALFDFAGRVGAEDHVNQDRCSGDDSLRQLTPEDKSFLEKALSQLVQDTDPIVLLKRNVKSLSALNYQSLTTDELDQALALLDQTTELCYHPDIANDFHNIGGYRLLVPLLASSTPDIRAGAAGLVGVMVQNNPYSQKQVFDAKLLPVLTVMAKADKNLGARIKGLFAIGSLIRDHEPSEHQFVLNNGLAMLSEMLRAAARSQKIVCKAAFLLTYLLRKEEHCVLAYDCDAHSSLIGNLSSEDPQVRELCSAALLVLLKHEKRAVEDCQSVSGLKEKLTGLLKASTGDDSLQVEENAQMEELISFLWPS